MIKTSHMIIIIFVIVAGLSGLYLLKGSIMPSSEENMNITIINTNRNPTTEIALPHITRVTGPIYVNATIFVSTNTLPVYHGVFEKNGSINIDLKPIFQTRQNVTTEKDAPLFTKKVMEPYGGLPEDAVYDGARTSYDETINLTLEKVVSREPLFTTVFYHRQINHLQVIGDSNSIVLTLGSDGELLRIVKVWRNYTFAGNVTIIPVEEAIDKLEREELVDSSWHPEEGDVTIDAIGLGYYARDIGNSETQLEPVWMMFGSGKTGSRLPFYVYARKFANFTANPTTGVPSEEISFRDMSDTTTTRWIWDFGDGTNSTRKHPTHSYAQSGTYNVSLTVWNDLGSDTLLKRDYISIRKSGQLVSPSATATRQINTSGSQ
jgi:hypothetical protein